MKHLTDEQIVAYIYKDHGVEKNEEIKEIEAHITLCDECAEKIKGVEKTIFEFERMDDSEPPPYLENKLLDFFDGIRNEGSLKLCNNNNNNGSNSNSGNNIGESNNDEVENDEIITPAELSKYLKIPAASIYELLDKLPHLIIAGQIRFRKKSIVRWLDLCEKNRPADKVYNNDLNDPIKLWRNII